MEELLSILRQKADHVKLTFCIWIVPPTRVHCTLGLFDMCLHYSPDVQLLYQRLVFDLCDGTAKEGWERLDTYLVLSKHEGQVHELQLLTSGRRGEEANYYLE